MKIKGKLIATHQKFAIISSRFNAFIVEHLLAGAREALESHGVAEADIDIIEVPGAFEIPLAALKAAETGRYSGIITLGAVIRGSTPHFDYVAGECAKGVSQVALSTKVPVAFGVLTTDNIEQAIERAGTKAGNKGAEAALTAIEMASVIQQLSNQ